MSEITSMGWIPSSAAALYRPIPSTSEDNLGFGGLARAVSADGVYAIYDAACPYVATVGEYVIVEDGACAFRASDGQLLSYTGDYIDGYPVYTNERGSRTLRYAAEYGAWVYYSGKPEYLPRARTKFGDDSVWIGDGWYQGDLTALAKAGTYLNDSGDASGTEGDTESGDITLTGYCPRWEKKAGSGDDIGGIYEPMDDAEGTMVVGDPVYQYESGDEAKKWRIRGEQLVEDGGAHTTRAATIEDKEGYAIDSLDAENPAAFYFGETLPSINNTAVFKLVQFNEAGEPEELGKSITFAFQKLDAAATQKVKFYFTEAVTLQ